MAGGREQQEQRYSRVAWVRLETFKYVPLIHGVHIYVNTSTETHARSKAY